MVTWPDITFPPINLYTVPPAWFFYATAKEKIEMYYREVMLIEPSKEEDEE